MGPFGRKIAGLLVPRMESLVVYKSSHLPANKEHDSACIHSSLFWMGRVNTCECLVLLQPNFGEQEQPKYTFLLGFAASNSFARISTTSLSAAEAFTPLDSGASVASSCQITCMPIQLEDMRQQDNRGEECPKYVTVHVKQRTHVRLLDGWHVPWTPFAFVLRH